MNLKTEISNNSIILMIVNSEKYVSQTDKLFKNLSGGKTTIVSVNKSYNALSKEFKKNKINEKNFYFVDCITKTLITPAKTSNCSFVSSPKALTEISLEISKQIDLSAPIIVIDSLSTLLIYHDEEVLKHFAYAVISKARADHGVKVIFLISDKDKKTRLFESLEIMSDTVINL